MFCVIFEKIVCSEILFEVKRIQNVQRIANMTVITVREQFRKPTGEPKILRLQYLLKNTSVRTRAAMLQNLSIADLSVGRIALNRIYSVTTADVHKINAIADSKTELIRYNKSPNTDAERAFISTE